MICIVSIIFLKYYKRRTEPDSGMVCGKNNIANGDGQTLNDSTNETIARELELSVYQNTSTAES